MWYTANLISRYAAILYVDAQKLFEKMLESISNAIESSAVDGIIHASDGASDPANEKTFFERFGTMARKKSLTVKQLSEAYKATVAKGQSFDDMAAYLKEKGHDSQLPGSLQSLVSARRSEGNRLSSQVEYKGETGIFAEIVGDAVKPETAIPDLKGGVNQTHAGVTLIELGNFGDKAFPKMGRSGGSNASPEERLSAFQDLIDI